MIRLLKRFFSIFGVDLPERGVFPIRLRRRYAVLVLLAILLVIAGGGVFFWQSSKSGFCNSCHIMEPYVDSWRESVHGQKGVECIQCHFPPGFQNAVEGKVQAASMLVAYLTGTYNTNVFAEIDDASCMRAGCHEKRLLEGRADFKGVHFDHKPHLTELRRGKRLRCQTCHSQIVQGSHITVTESVCFTCHFKDLKHGRIEEPVAGCTGCHDVPDTPIQLVTGDEYNHADYVDRDVKCFKCHFDSVQGDGNVPRQVCIACHSEPDRLEKFDDPRFMHKHHVTDHKIECIHCHSEIRHGRNPEANGSEPVCNRCHTGKHSYPASVYRGTGARGVPDQPSGMWAAKVQCIACHETLGGTAGHAPQSTYKGGEKSCIHCHGDDVEGMLADWQAESAEAVKKAADDLAKAEKAAKTLADGEAKAKADKLLDDARHNLDLVRYGKGAHNLEYATAVLEAVSANAAEVRKLAEAP